MNSCFSQMFIHGREQVEYGNIYSTGWAQTWADPTWAMSRITEKITKMLGYEKDALRGSLEGAMNQIGWFLMFYLPAKTCSKFSYQAKELLNFWYHHRKEWYRILHLTPVTIKFQQKLRKKGVCFPENSLKCEVLNAVFPQSSQRYADVSSHYSSLHSADGILLRLTLSKGKL